jgi:hypothetical protein
MKTLKLLPLVTLLFASCAADELVDVVIPDEQCGSSGARMEATVDGSAWCANTSVIGLGDGSSVIITGISLLGGTLVLQADSLAVGPHVINEAENTVMFMNLSLPFTPLNTDPGQLIIATLDTTGHRITGTFDVTVHTDGGGSKPISGAFDVNYLQQ